MKSDYDRIVDTARFAALLELEELTNPRVREELGDLRKIRKEDMISGPGTTPIMASFAYSEPSRFCDGTFGVYYAGNDEATAIAESLYHTEKRLREWREPSIDVDKRMYAATLEGDFDDIRGRSRRSPLYDPDETGYSYTQGYARKLYEANAVDGIVYRSVRNPDGHCAAAFRPRVVSSCRAHKYLQFRWDGKRIVGIAEISEIRAHE